MKRLKIIISYTVMYNLFVLLMFVAALPESGAEPEYGLFQHYLLSNIAVIVVAAIAKTIMWCMDVIFD